MQLTAQQPTRRTLTDFYRAIDHQHCLTITYLKRGETTPRVRTVEIHELRTVGCKVKKGRVTGGGIVVIAMCRLRGARREFHLDGILAYTLHRGTGYVLTMPANTVYEDPEPQPAHDAQALFFYELARDQDDADYRPRVRLAA